MAKILLVEDIADSAELVRRILALRGHEVLHAPDAESGLQMAIGSRPDLILLDLGLPDVDGQTLIGWLRREPDLAHTPIVAVTAWPEDTVRRMVDVYGCDGYIRKPIEAGKFADQVAGYLR